MIEPAIREADTPTVVLAGKDWPIPELVWRDLRKCRKELIELTDLINAAMAAAITEDDPDEGELQRGLRRLGLITKVFDHLSNEDYDRLVMGPLLAALQSANHEVVDGKDTVVS